METLRAPFQGVTNIIRFNWPFYAVTGGGLVGLLGSWWLFTDPYRTYLVGLAGLMLLGIGLSLLVSWYVYDRSDLYALNWLAFVKSDDVSDLVTVNAGFDETSALLHRRFPDAMLHVFDFYNPAQHTEPSISRARAAYPPYPGTQVIRTATVPLADGTADLVLLILAAHEIRQDDERIRFFAELKRVLKPTGTVVVVEHLRDVPNFLAYSIGFVHFLSSATWLTTFAQAGFQVEHKSTITPFVTVFRLVPDGTSR